MRIAIDMSPGFHPGWKMAAGALEYAAETEDMVILLPHARLSRPEDTDPSTWDGAIVDAYKPGLPVPQICAAPISPEGVQRVAVDDESIVRLAVDQFLSMGLRHFAMMGMPVWPVSELRWNIFSRLLEEKGFAPVLVPANLDWSKAMECLPKPCGLMAFNDFLACDLLDRAEELNLRIPGDLYVISVDDTPSCLETTPTLSSISMPFALVGYYAAKLCAQIIDGLPMESIRIQPSGLILRESTKADSDDVKTATEIADFLRKNIAYPIQMDDLVHSSNRCRRSLEYLFQKAYGKSPIAYLKAQRLNRAQELLCTSSRPLKEIAKSCGYRDVNHLCRIFRKRLQSTPLSYRKRNSSM